MGSGSVLVTVTSISMKGCKDYLVDRLKAVWQGEAVIFISNCPVSIRGQVQGQDSRALLN